MKLSKLSKIIKKGGKRITCFVDVKGTQWIGSIYGIYPLYGVTRLTNDQMPIVLDIPYKEREEYLIVDVAAAMQRTINEYIDNLDLNTFIDFKDNNFSIDGVKYFDTNEGIRMIKTADLQVADIEGESESTLYYKYIPEINAIIIVNGLIIVGIIECRDCITQELVIKYKKIYTSLKQAWQEKQEKLETEKAVIDQMNFESLKENE